MALRDTRLLRQLAPRLISLLAEYERADGGAHRSAACPGKGRATGDCYEEEPCVYDLPPCVRPSRLLGLVAEVLGDDFAFFPSGEMLIWQVARHEGYNIPAYPMAGCGDCKEFLADYGARDVPSWYEDRGISRQTVASFYAYSCIMARNREYWRKIMLVPVGDVDDANALAAHLVRALRFCDGRQDGAADPTLFRC